MMSSDRDKRAVFGKGIAFDPCQLRDPWENRAQKISEKGQQEKEGQENRDLNRLIKERHIRLMALEKKGKGRNMVYCPLLKRFRLDPPLDAAPPPPPPPPTPKKSPRRVKIEIPKPVQKKPSPPKPSPPPLPKVILSYKDLQRRSEGKWWRGIRDRELPNGPSEWSKPFKCRPLQFSRILYDQTMSWQRGWPTFSREKSNKLLKVKPLDDKVNLKEWKDSWKMSRPLPKQHTENRGITEKVKAFREWQNRLAISRNRTSTAVEKRGKSSDMSNFRSKVAPPSTIQKSEPPTHEKKHDPLLQLRKESSEENKPSAPKSAKPPAPQPKEKKLLAIKQSPPQDDTVNLPWWKKVCRTSKPSLKQQTENQMIAETVKTGTGDDMSDSRKIVMSLDNDADIEAAHLETRFGDQVWRPSLEARFGVHAKVVPPPTPPTKKREPPKKSQFDAPPKTQASSDILDVNKWSEAWRTQPLLLNIKEQVSLEAWEQEWPEFTEEQSDKRLNAKPLDDNVNLTEWGDAWKTPKPLAKQHTEDLTVTETVKPKALTGWREARRLSGDNVQNNPPSLKDWRDSWSFCQEHRWWKVSMDSQMSKQLFSHLRKRGGGLFLFCFLFLFLCFLGHNTDWGQ
ncbi:uncharacterized protein LOC110537018 isoform X2 [Oncorhynchus mykiss]|uniref:uncharacterized protein LOC110537018 isoform X2 n=1 Tax=Oncorhynchus mykiss TaxID=8022 RepID=UPI001878620A|nr:uncharacterized protein LOC110537018 isoform X2 [Oncorhynchus mykiss]